MSHSCGNKKSVGGRAEQGGGSGGDFSDLANGGTSDYASGTIDNESQPPLIGGSESLREISLIESLTSFLEAHGGRDVNPGVLRNMAEALSEELTITNNDALQDARMDDQYGMAYRSYALNASGVGHTSPTSQGRSVREYEEQMTQLRKDNFNLRLRIYFLEQTLPTINANGDTAELVKKLTDAQVASENFRIQLENHKKLLKDAGDALNHFDNMREDYLQKIRELKERLEKYEQNALVVFDDDATSTTGYDEEQLVAELKAGSNDDDGEKTKAEQKILELEAIIAENGKSLAAYKEKVNILEESMQQCKQVNEEYEIKLQDLTIRNSELLEIICLKDQYLQDVEAKIMECKNSIFLLQQENDKIHITVDKLNSNVLDQKSVANHAYQDLQKTKLELADKTCLLQDTEEKLEDNTKRQEQSLRTMTILLKSLKNQQEEKARTAQGQEVVSKETVNSQNVPCIGLCRNLSITELTINEKKDLEAIIQRKEEKIQKLEIELKQKNANLQTLVNKELWEKNREIERLTKVINATAPTHSKSLNAAAVTLSHNLQKSFSDAEQSNITILERNKLLQRKIDILKQRLHAERNNEELISQLRSELREASIKAEAAKQWRSECVDVCMTLSTRLEELAGFLNSLLKHKDVIGALAVDRRRAMRKAVDRSLDLSKNLNMRLSVSGVGNLSATEHSMLQISNLSAMLNELGIENKTFDSHEADVYNSPSIEKLKAENKALRKELDKRRNIDVRKERRSLPVPLLENHSESEAWSEPDRNVSLARMGLEDHSVSLNSKDQPISKVTTALTDSDTDSLDQNPNLKTYNQDRIAQLEKLISQRDERILEIQCQLVDADNQLKRENLRALDMRQEIEQLRQRNEELANDLFAFGTDIIEHSKHDQTLQLQQRAIEEKTESLKNLQEKYDNLLSELRTAESQISSLKSNLEDMQLQHEIVLNFADEREKDKLAQLRTELERTMQERICECERKHSEILERDFVARSIYEEHVNKIQKELQEALQNIDYLTENEQDLKQNLIDCEMTVRALRKQLDQSTLQASQAVLERVKVQNEKLEVEKRLQEMELELESERNQLQHKLEQLKSVQQTLQLKLEAAQRQQASEASHSGYASEDVPAPMIGSSANLEGAFPGSLEPGSAVIVEEAPVSSKAGEAKAQRLSNASPDLGIESDTGRVSSVELSNVYHPMLTNIELPGTANLSLMKHEVMNEICQENVNPNTQLPPTAANPSSSSIAKHDCAKVDQEIQELRHKLIRSNRTLKLCYEKISLSNQCKAQIESEIKNQLLKTQNVLKNARRNMEN